MAVNLYKPGAEPSDIPETCTVEESELSSMLASGWMVAPETSSETPKVEEPAVEAAMDEAPAEAEAESTPEAPAE